MLTNLINMHNKKHPKLVLLNVNQNVLTKLKQEVNLNCLFVCGEKSNNEMVWIKQDQIAENETKMPLLDNNFEIPNNKIKLYEGA